MRTDPGASDGDATARRAEPARLRLEIRGAVQGVGFRPFVYRLATERALAGWVLNDSRGVFLEVEGPRQALERFAADVPALRPPRARIDQLDASWLPPAGLTGFEIRHSDGAGARTAVVLPDVATCADCLAEMNDPQDRRHGYPFTNCTNCGPRFTIVRALPYDRPNTTMAGFAMCARCRAEYEDPRDRRFHAQPNACPDCGPQLALWDAAGAPLAERDDALAMAAADLAAGRTLAVQGLGGFHLVCDASDDAAVQRLRERKPRLEKPFALMARDLEQARTLCEVDDAAAAALAGAEAPIVLLPRRDGAPVAPSVAPGLRTLGVMLAYTPLHHRLLAAFGRPIVATSGNLTDEPIATEPREALRRLGHVADRFLVHDRPIERHVDDSVGWIVDGELALLRRARGFAPLPVRVARELPPILGVGAHLKSTVALGVARQVFVSQHIGDLETAEALEAFERVIADFLRLYEAVPVAIAHDLHPDYVSTRWALRDAAAAGVPDGARRVAVQHHHAHLASCLAEHRADGPALGVIWDGTGYGTDGTTWGGEFLLGDARGFERVAHLRRFRLPGGDAAVREPRRVALALLWELLGERALGRDDLAPVASLSVSERSLFARMLASGAHAPVTTSAGRLFDGAAALAGLHPRVTYEAQAAIAFEALADPGERGAYPMALIAGSGTPLVLDWAPMVEALAEDVARGAAPATVSARFHNGLVGGIVSAVEHLGAARVALSGGCFQNRRLADGVARALRAGGREVLRHREVPANDGGVSLGQVMVAAAALAAE